MRIVGFDPGWAKMGIMRFQEDDRRLVYLDSKLVQTTPKQKIQERTNVITRAITWALEDGPGLVGIEEQLSFFSQTQASNKSSEQVRHIVTLVRAQSVQGKWDVDECRPVHMRMALGVPRNSYKRQMEKMLRALVKGVPDGLSEHEYDAGAAGYCIWRRYRRPKLVSAT